METMKTAFTNDNLPVEIQLSGSQYQESENVSPPAVADLDEAYGQLTYYEKSRAFNDTGLESIIQKKVRHTIQAGLECSNIVQELVLGHAEETEWQSRRKEYFRSTSRRLDAQGNKLKYMQCRNPLMTIFDNLIFGSSRYLKNLFAA
jgi:hypothetical protein